MKRLLIAILCMILCQHVSAQNNDSLFSRLSGLSNAENKFFNIDGIGIVVRTVNAAFTTKSIVKNFSGFNIKEKDLTAFDSTLKMKNFYVSKSLEEPKGNMNYASYYFIEQENKNILGVYFLSVNKHDKDFEKRFINLLIKDSIPSFVYSSMSVDSINFAGRKIPLGGSCRWMGINNVQCQGYGQMNWSVHKTLEDAKASVDAQFRMIHARPGTKIISDTTAEVIFEGTEINAKKIVIDFKGVRSVLVGMSGGKTLTVYLVAVPVRNNFVSCVMSFWNNDQINPSGLPPLLEQVMKLK